MGARKYLNRILKPISGYYVEKTHFGSDLWNDVLTLCGRDSRTVFDVGANEGQSARNFLSLFPNSKIYSFEPLPEAFAALEALARSHKRIVPLKVALGAEKGAAILNQNAMNATSSVLTASSLSGAFVSGTALSTQRRVDIPLATLDAVATEHRIDSIDLLKIDVQGYELEVLKGASQMLGAGRIRAIVLELNFAPLYEQQASFHDINTLLKSHGFGLSCFYDFAFSTQNQLMWCDALFCRSD